MTAEPIFNLYMLFEHGSARRYRACSHPADGSDEQKLEFLKGRVERDYPSAKEFALPRAFTPEQWLAAQRFGEVLEFFEAAFIEFEAGPAPLYCLTSVIDGVITVDLVADAAPFRGDQVTAKEGRGAVPDYLVHYVDGKHFRFNTLIDDDYFKAIKLLFNAGLYVSSAKLLMSCIDTLAFVEFGDVPGNFPKWLDSYVDLKAQGITSEELWEFRNSVLHTTTLESRKVAAGKVSPIAPYVAHPATVLSPSPGSLKPFNLYGLMMSVIVGIGKWLESYTHDRVKILTFIERYDRTISDSRFAQFVKDDSAPSV